MLTGAAAGIGAALAERYAEQGSRLILSDIDQSGLARLKQRLQKIQPQLPIESVEADLVRPEALAELVGAARRAGGVDCVALSAGISAVGRFDELPLAHLDRLLRINLYAPCLLCAALLRDELLRPGGQLIFLSSLGVYTGYPGAAVYAASKAAVAAMAGCLEVALHGRSSHALAVFPGPVRTAHAQRYSPDNRRASRRMLPERLAEQIVAAAGATSRLIPGAANRFFALFGLLLPRASEAVMRRAILDRLRRPLL